MLRTLKGTRYRLEEYHQKETDGREVESWIPETEMAWDISMKYEIRNTATLVASAPFPRLEKTEQRCCREV